MKNGGIKWGGEGNVREGNGRGYTREDEEGNTKLGRGNGGEAVREGRRWMRVNSKGEKGDMKLGRGR